MRERRKNKAASSATVVVTWSVGEGEVMWQKNVVTCGSTCATSVKSLDKPNGEKEVVCLVFKANNTELLVK